MPTRKVTIARCVLTLALCAAILTLLSSSGEAAALGLFGKRSAPPWGAIVVGQQSEAERLATLDLQRYLGQVNGHVPVIIQADDYWMNKRPANALILGTPETNKVLADLKLDLALAGQEGYLLEERTLGKTRLVLAAGQTPQGAVQAVYGLLRELGYGFYLGSEAVPERLPEHLAQPRLVRAPALKIRGVLPWYNFFNSPTAWDPIDHRAFVDQLTRMGANFVGFHTYENEPFGAREQDGRMQWGARLLNSATSTWSTHPLASKDFAFGSSLLYADPYFGAATTFLKNDDEAIRREQDVMRDALDYAHRRGLHTCLGFEMIGNPTNPADREVFLKRLNHIIDQYPSLDYLWLWQSECQGAQGFMPPDPADPILPYGIARRDTFKRIVERHAGARPFFQDNEVGKVARAMEGARLEQFAQLAWQVLAHRQQAPRLVLSGWGGDERILSAEYYEGLDKLLPKEIIFASLDNIPPRKRVDTIYHELPKDRERWPIVWLEGDGDQWHPQPVIQQYYEDCVRDIQQSGSQGFLAIHWRTREIEENFAYLLQAAWQPGLSAKEFFADYARRSYGPKLGSEMADIHQQLDKLEYRWVSGVGQSECAPFDWGPGIDSKAAELEALHARTSKLMNESGPLRPAVREKVEWLLHRMEWVLAFRQTELAAVKARELLAQARTAQPEQARANAEEALALLDRGDFPKALQAYSQLISTRGEYGVLATINTKAVFAWRELRQQALQILKRTDAEPAAESWQPQPQILLPRFIGSVSQGEAMELMPIVLGGKPAWIHYRPLGAKKWTTRPLEHAANWVRRVTIPAEAVKEPGIEIAFSFSANPKTPAALGPLAMTVMPRLAVDTQPKAILTAEAGMPAPAPTVREGTALPLELTWTALAQADFYKVYRDGRLMVETAVPAFPDAPGQAQGRYVVEAWRAGKCIGRSEPVSYAVPDRSITETPDAKAFPNHAGILLRWPATRSPQVAAYAITRRGLVRDRNQAVQLAQIPASRVGDHVYFDRPNKGQWEYEVRAVGATGRQGTAVKVRADFPPKDAPRPVVDLPLNVTPAGATVSDQVTFGPEGARLNGGTITLPHQDSMNLGNGLTVMFEFKAEDLSGMPVILCHGMSMGDGWFAQIMGGRLHLSTTFGSCAGPMIEPGRWYSVRWVFDGLEGRLAVNGQWLADATSPIRPLPTERDLIIGQYDAPAPHYAFHGQVRNLRIYRDVLTDPTSPR